MNLVDKFENDVDLDNTAKAAFFALGVFEGNKPPHWKSPEDIRNHIDGLIRTLQDSVGDQPLNSDRVYSVSGGRIEVRLSNLDEVWEATINLDLGYVYL